MLSLSFPQSSSRQPLRVLCLGAHCDDIDIGCGGTLLKLLAEQRRVEVTWVSFSAAGPRGVELKASARRFLRKAQRSEVITYDFRDSFFPAQYQAVKEAFVALRKRVDADVVFTHERDDLHQDHRIVSELTWNAFRNHLVLEYEIPKYDGGLTTPNAYVPLDAGHVEGKVRALMSCYRSQLARSWFTPETFRALMRIRGIEAGCAWAEGFHANKLCLA
jgi:LmbE family N-acetylglucosaminyl deacetylase